MRRNVPEELQTSGIRPLETLEKHENRAIVAQRGKESPHLGEERGAVRHALQREKLNAQLAVVGNETRPHRPFRLSVGLWQQGEGCSWPGIAPRPFP